MAEIVLKNVNKVYENGFHAVNNVNLTISPHDSRTGRDILR